MAHSANIASPHSLPDRGLGQYLSQLNETAPEGEKIFDIDDWKEKTLLDIGSSGYDRFGMEARARGVRVVSLNPALQKEEARAMLRDGVVMGQRKCTECRLRRMGGARLSQTGNNQACRSAGLAERKR